MISAPAMGNRASDGVKGTFAVFGNPVTDLRKELLEKLAIKNQNAMLASKCLSWIDDIRDRYGNGVDEPRHPVIKSGRPWPSQALTARST